MCLDLSSNQARAAFHLEAAQPLSPGERPSAVPYLPAPLVQHPWNQISSVQDGRVGKQLVRYMGTKV